MKHRMTVSKVKCPRVFVNCLDKVLLYGWVEGRVWNVETDEALTASLLCWRISSDVSTGSTII